MKPQRGNPWRGRDDYNTAVSMRSLNLFLVSKGTLGLCFKNPVWRLRDTTYQPVTLDRPLSISTFWLHFTYKMGVILVSVSKSGGEDCMNQLVARNTMIMMMIIIIKRPMCTNNIYSHLRRLHIRVLVSSPLPIQSLSHPLVILLNGGDKKML